jgi:phosphoribosylanthranilate isomerase
MIVKICGITRREDAVAAVEAGADAIGFIFYPPSPRYVTPEEARQLGDGLNVLKVGVFVDATVNQATLDLAALDVAQIYGSYKIAGGIRHWQAIRLPTGTGGFGYGSTGGTEAILVDGAANGLPCDWEKAKMIGEKHNVIVAGGLDDSNVAEAIRVAQPWGVDASSRLEASPGIKDHEKVRRFIDAARRAS